MKEFHVAVFVHRHNNSKRKKLPYQVNAYLRDYNPEWGGFNSVKTLGKNGEDAKRRAIKIIKAQLEIQPGMVNISSPGRE